RGRTRRARGRAWWAPRVWAVGGYGVGRPSCPGRRGTMGVVRSPGYPSGAPPGGFIAGADVGYDDEEAHMTGRGTDAVAGRTGTEFTDELRALAERFATSG